ncbi:MAG: outer membrane beta-barrel protein [Acidiferrobacterales bacterium]|jgi:OOP family OmpA-OmpF porin|nr:outer membrane beta-barrel protein [Acidiferrobacterales bacterium]
MNIHKCLRFTSATLLLATASVSYASGPWYAGAAGGSSSTGASIEEMHPNLVADHGAINSVLSKSTSSTGWKAFVGYQYNPKFAVEGSYTSFGTYSSEVDTAGDGLITTKLNPTAWCLSGIGTHSLQNKFGLTGRVGICKWDDGFSSSVAEPIAYSDGFAPVVGLGASFGINPNLTVRAEYERYFGVIHGDKEADLISLGVAFGF